MNSRIIFQYLLILLVGFSACKKETTVVKEPLIDNYIYAVDGEKLYQSSAEKTKQKTPEQYLSILYSNLFRQTIPQEELREMAEVRQSVGDKQLVDELTLNSYAHRPDVQIPSNQQMRADIDQFVEQTFLRFFLRLPSPYELYELRNAIEEDPGLTPELIYQGFAISNEYKFY